MQKKILYIDMDGVVADFEGAIKKLCAKTDVNDFDNSFDRVNYLCEVNSDIFLNLEPMPNAVMAVLTLFHFYDVYFLSTPMWNVPTSYTHKRWWIERHFPIYADNRLILTHRKDLNIGHFLVDDSLRNGADKFTGQHIHFGSEQFPDWPTVFQYLYSNR